MPVCTRFIDVNAWAAKKRELSMDDTETENEQAPESANQVYNLRLYVAGQTPRSLRAFANLRDICDKHLAGRYTIEVIDLLKNPQLAQGDQILAIPTLVRKLPPPLRKIIGDLSNTEKVLVGLDLKPRSVR